MRKTNYSKFYFALNNIQTFIIIRFPGYAVASLQSLSNTKLVENPENITAINSFEQNIMMQHVTCWFHNS